MPSGSLKAFAELLDRLVLTPSRNGKLRLIATYLADTPDPDRGIALAILAGELSLKAVKANLFRTLAEEHIDPILFRLSYDYVGDLAETVSLVWPQKADNAGSLGLADCVARLEALTRAEAPAVVADLLDRLNPAGRWALIKLATGGLRIGISARLTKQALALYGGKDVAEIEELWHGLKIPYGDLFAWLEGGEKPKNTIIAGFSPVMLSHPLDAALLSNLDLRDYQAEWKWDGIRVQAVGQQGVARLYSRSGEDISGAFPDVVEAIDFDAVIDGELLARVPKTGRTGTFSDLQQRLNRKTVSSTLLAKYPVMVRAYDLLRLDGEDLRERPLSERRERLDTFIANLDSDRFDISPALEIPDAAALSALRANPPEPPIEGVMLKRRDAPYVAGRPKGQWWKWKRDPFNVDAVLMYAQRGHGKRSGIYSDFTFGVWQDGETGLQLVPVGKAYFGFTDAELAELDRFVRNNTVERYGPVRSVRAEPQHGLVLEIAFEGLNRSKRHRSGVAMRFPRISRIRWDKKPIEADRIGALEILLD
ncbi:MAG: cisplatin damage response ATP-dependent DNA ligase [Rhodobiaceae bacterium]|nr:cisplatin damage response ATP-dependent DNA ligase [Rhodobiaceae bacterium]MCC0055085.1 cisplatin damage response ATP-dependent DNA ligase [Rhodobiaceae bacterium]